MANTVLLEARPYRPFKSSEEYLYAMREDLAEWLNLLYPDLRINTENFMDRLDTGVALCKHAHNVRTAAEEYLARRHARNKSMTKSITSGLAGPILAMGNIHFLPAAKSGTFFARDNVSNFISWCRKSLQIFECLLFETDDLIMRKNEKHVILCLLEVARRGAKFGMLAPMLVQMERQIDREIAADNRANGTQTELGTNTLSTGTNGVDVGCGGDNDGLFDTDSEDEEENNEPVLMYGPQPQIITNDLKSLDEMVRDLVEKCTCPSQFPMVRVSEGKYRIGDTKVLIFVRILRSHVMVRVGGGWDTLSHYLDKHDPCRCKAQHRSSVAARLITRTNYATNGIELHKAQVFYERSPPSARKVINGVNNQNNQHTNGLNNEQNSNNSHLSLPNTTNGINRSRSPTPQRRVGFSPSIDHQTNDKHLLASPKVDRRSMSPSPRHIPPLKKKQLSLDSATIPTSSSSSSTAMSLHSLSSASPSPQPSAQTMVITTTTTPSPIPSETISTTTNGTTTKLSPSTTDDSSSNNEYNNEPNNKLIELTNTNQTNTDNGKYENISDNGSEISDEGYRSLGIIQANNQLNNLAKRSSFLSQNSTDDAEINVRHNSSDSQQTSPIDDQISSSRNSITQIDGGCYDAESPSESLTQNITNAIENQNESTTNESKILDDVTPVDNSCITNNTNSSTSNTLNSTNNTSFEQSGVYITDDDITIDIASSTGLRKTGFSANLYGDDEIPLKPLFNGNSITNDSKIPRSPITIRRRKSVENVSVKSIPTATMSRKTPVYQSVRKIPTTANNGTSKSNLSSTLNNNVKGSRISLNNQLHKPTTTTTTTTNTKDIGGNTWSGRSTHQKKRSTIGTDTFQSPQHGNSSSFNRNSTTRASCQQIPNGNGSGILYDKNGRRINKSNTTSPIKLSGSTTPTPTSPLAQQILEAAGQAKNDAQMLEKMKSLLSKYTKTKDSIQSVTSTSTSPVPSSQPTPPTTSQTPQSQSPSKEYDDFTTAWVNSNGSLDRSSSVTNCCTTDNNSTTSSSILLPTTNVKVNSKRSSTTSSIDSSSASRDPISGIPILATAIRRENHNRGLSRIPGPIRQNSELY